MGEMMNRELTDSMLVMSKYDSYLFSCSICLCPFVDRVDANCGHSFCGKVLSLLTSQHHASVRIGNKAEEDKCNVHCVEDKSPI